MKKKVLIIDNYDSFTYILKQYFGELNANPEVHFNDQISIAQIKKINPTHIVLSPGPGNTKCAKDIGIMPKIIKEFAKKIPILGVCLGHQMLAQSFGGEISNAPQIMHGKRSWIHHNNAGIFKGIKSPFEAMRYHSLMVKDPGKLTITAQTADNIIMGLEHPNLPIYGVQFHPESLGTEHGKKLLTNFLSS